MFLIKLNVFFSRIPPTYGLFIFYDVKTIFLYYDFTEKIIERLDNEKNTDWRENEEVNINIPIINRLDEEKLNFVYETLKRRFENTNLLIYEHSAKYDIPSLNIPIKVDYTISSLIDKIENAGCGNLIFNKKRFDILEALFDQISKKTN